MRTNKVFWLAISVCAVIVCWAGTRSLGDPAHFVVDPSTGAVQYSGKGSASIGSWYDEAWQAGSFFLLKPNPVSHGQYLYESTLDPVTATHGNAPVFQQGNSTIPQDIVVTQWRVAGHVHFASSGM
jgi:hypothetical protein